MRDVVLIDGRRVAPRRATLRIDDRIVLYADGVFETLRVYGGRPFALGEHLERLRISAKVVGLPEPPTRAIERDVSRAVEAAGRGDGWMRIRFGGGASEAGLHRNAAGVRRIVELRALDAPKGVASVRAVCVRDRDVRLGPPRPKCVSYLSPIVALHEAWAAGADDALLIDARGRIARGASANVFVRTGSVVRTPRPAADVLDGVTSSYVRKIIRKHECSLVWGRVTRGRALQADEIVLTSSVREIASVVRLDGEAIGSGRIGSLARHLSRELRRLTR